MKIKAFFFCFLLVDALSAQSFVASPAPMLQQELAFNEANECFIYFDNPTGDTLHLKWRQLEVSLPEGWTADLCDYGLCYTGIPVNGNMNPVYDTIRPYLKLIVQPGALPGSAWLWFRALEIGNDANFVDVYFNLFTPGTVATHAPKNEAPQIFPNPADTELFVENSSGQSVPAKLSDLNGRIRWQGVLESQSRKTIDLHSCPAGFYFLQTPGSTQKVQIVK